MIEIVRLIEQLDVQKTDQKEPNTPTIKQTKRNAERKQRQERKVDVQPRLRPRLDPREAKVIKVKRWSHIKLVNPVVQKKAHNPHKHQETKEHPKRHERRSIHRRKKILSPALLGCCFHYIPCLSQLVGCWKETLSITIIITEGHGHTEMGNNID